MTRLDYPRLPIVISLVLGSGLERISSRVFFISNGNWAIFVERPISLALTVLLVLALVAPAIRWLINLPAIVSGNAA